VGCVPTEEVTATQTKESIRRSSWPQSSILQFLDRLLLTSDVRLSLLLCARSTAALQAFHIGSAYLKTSERPANHGKSILGDDDFHSFDLAHNISQETLPICGVRELAGQFLKNPIVLGNIQQSGERQMKLQE
jgi:hypothetical protein